MKKLCLLCSAALLPAFLFSCQAESGSLNGEEIKSVSETLKSEELFEEGVVKIEVAQIKGVDPLVYREAEDLAVFKKVFSSATKEPGTVNMTEPEYYLNVFNDTGDEQHLYLWIGGKGEQSTLMHADHTHTIYSIPFGLGEQLLTLLDDE